MFTSVFSHTFFGIMAGLSRLFFANSGTRNKRLPRSEDWVFRGSGRSRKGEVEVSTCRTAARLYFGSIGGVLLERKGERGVDGALFIVLIDIDTRYIEFVREGPRARDR